MLPLTEQLANCTVEIIKAVLLSADNNGTAFTGTHTERADLSEALRAIQARVDVAAAARAKKGATEGARQKRLAAGRQNKQGEGDVRIAKGKAGGQARAVESRGKIQAACAATYKKSLDKKDLTVKEKQEVKECQALGLY